MVLSVGGRFEHLLINVVPHDGDVDLRVRPAVVRRALPAVLSHDAFGDGLSCKLDTLKSQPLLSRRECV